MSALRKLEKSVAKARTASERHAAYEDLAEYYYGQKAFENALDSYEHELQAAIDLKDAFKIAKAHRMIGEMKCELALYDEALKHQKKYYEYACDGDGERLPEQQRALTTLGRTLFLKGESLHEQGHLQDSPKAFSQARDLFLKSLLVCQKLEKRSDIGKTEVNEMQARSLLNLGLVYEGLGDPEKAVVQINLALRVCKANNLQSTQRLCLMSLTCLYIRKGDIQQALLLIKEISVLARSLPEQERVPALCELYVIESDAHLKRGDIHSARKQLQKAYAMTSPMSGEKEAIGHKLKTVASLDMYRYRLLQSSDLPHAEKAYLYEKLGDGFCNKGLYNHALEYYKKMLESSKMADLNLKPCYVSLAQTSKDLKQYSNAIQYFKEEMAISSPKEGILSLLAIAECQEEAGLSATERLATYEQAYKLAENASDIKLKHKVLVEIEQVQRSAGMPEADDTKCMKEKLAASLPDNESSESEDEANTPDLSADVDLDALSDCSDSGDEEEFDRRGDTSKTTEVRPRRNPQRQQETARWRNEKGETKLHLACINGKLTAVRTLLEQGCDINAMDNAGWTPLHEACNHGYPEIVNLLLDKGANINHKGGPDAGGITPLHDSASAGNFDIMNVLLDRKASVTLLTDEGHTALDTLLEFYNRGGQDLTAEETQEYQHVVDRLNALLEKVGQSRKDALLPQKNKSKSSPQSRAVRRSLCDETLLEVGKDKISPKMSNVGKLRKEVEDLDDPIVWKRKMRGISPVHSEHESHSLSHIQTISDEDEGHEGVNQYQQVMKDLRKNSSVNQKPSDSQRRPLKPLLCENEVIMDWLEDDIGHQPTKKRKTNEFKAKTNTKKSSSSKNTSRLSLGQNSGGAKGQSSCTQDSQIMDRLSSNVLESDDGFLPVPDLNEHSYMDGFWKEDPFMDDIRPETPETGLENNLDTGSSQLTRIRRQSSLLSLGVTKKRRSTELPSQPPTALHEQPMSQLTVSQVPVQNRINVRIENRLLAMPVPAPNLTIGWLAEEAAKRYYKVEGVWPILTLQTADGAWLANDDPVSLLLGGDEIVGCVQSLNVPPITNRYKESCEILGVEIDNSVLPHLEASQATQALEIVDSILSAPVLKPVFKAIAMEHSLLKLNLCNNSMRDEGLKELCEQLGRLVNLRELDISGNGITCQGMIQLANSASNGNLQTLCDLNISHNDLRDGCISSLSKLTTSLPCLSGIAMANCGFTKHLWDGHNHLLTLSKVHSLDLSANQLYAKGLAGFLGFSDFDENRRLSPDHVKTLRLIGVAGSLLCQELTLFLERARRIALQELHLSYLSMHDEDITVLMRVLRNAPELHTVRIPSSRYITATSVSQLLLQPSLHHLEVLGKPDMWKNTDLENFQESVSLAARHMETLSLKNPPELVQETFRKTWGSNSNVKRGACGLFLLKFEGG